MGISSHLDFFFVYKKMHTYKITCKNLQNWIFPAQKALAPKFLGKTV